MVAAMRRAVEVGVNFFDTADAYGDGYSESVIGEALKPLPRDSVVIATKVYNRFYPDGRRHGDLSRDYVLAECDASLKRLRTDYIDLYQCHSFDVTAPIEETADAMERLRVVGKVRAYGVSNFSVEQMRVARKHGAFTTLQPRYNLLQPEAEEDLLPYCAAEGMGTLVYSPLAMGLLSGKYTGDEKFDDFRARDPNFQGGRFRDVAGRVRSLKPIADRYGLTIVQIVLAATLANPMVHCVIVGVKKAAHIEEAAAAMGKTVSREDYYAIRDALGTM
jgi:aryl-alcohol dehydrogenase-like predicted oxidoreductase